VDGVAKIGSINDNAGSWVFTFQLDKHSNSKLIIEKGSIAVNGVSLTTFNMNENNFSVAIIPFTFEHTTFKNLKEGDEVNIEFDMLGKYMARLVIGSQ
jgi:riboflavin synthase